MRRDRELIQKPYAIDVLLRLITMKDSCKAEVMRSYADPMTKTVSFRLSEMDDLGWIEYRGQEYGNRRIAVTDKGRDIAALVADMLSYVEEAKSEGDISRGGNQR